MLKSSQNHDKCSAVARDVTFGLSLALLGRNRFLIRRNEVKLFSGGCKRPHELSSASIRYNSGNGPGEPIRFCATGA